MNNIGFCTPEKAGISSRHVLNFYKQLEQNHLSTHGVVMARGNDIFSEGYYAPFHKDFLHRIYSATKTFASIAIGFCEQDGLLSFSDRLLKFFPEYEEKCTIRNNPTIQEILEMRTPLAGSGLWMRDNPNDRPAYYFEKITTKLPGTLFHYDTTGSYMLSAVVERVSGKPFLDYMREKFLDDIGFSKDAYCLTCPGGHAWGDSGILCTTRDMMLVGRFLLNGGTWNGKRYLNEEFVKKATTTCFATNVFGFEDLDEGYGVGYVFWGAPKGCYAACGAGNQVYFCDPAHDFVFAINSSNAGNNYGYKQIYTALYRYIIDNLQDSPLPEDPEALAELEAYVADRKLFCLYDSPTSDFAEKINGKVFDCEKSATGIRWFRLDFNGDEGTFTYENEQGEKSMTFGFGHNVFHKFPETGYAGLVGTVPVPGNQYDAAFSADWPEPQVLRIRAQIIDIYFGNLGMLIGFQDENHVTIRMCKSAEAFLNEYEGFINATAR